MILVLRIRFHISRGGVGCGGWGVGFRIGILLQVANETVEQTDDGFRSSSQRFNPLRCRVSEGFGNRDLRLQLKQRAASLLDESTEIALRSPGLFPRRYCLGLRRRLAASAQSARKAHAEENPGSRCTSQWPVAQTLATLRDVDKCFHSYPVWCERRSDAEVGAGSVPRFERVWGVGSGVWRSCGYRFTVMSNCEATVIESELMMKKLNRLSPTPHAPPPTPRHTNLTPIHLTTANRLHTLAR